MKMSKDSSTNIMKIIKKDYKIKPVTNIKLFLKKKKKEQYDGEWNKNLPQDEKQKLVEYSKKN